MPFTNWTTVLAKAKMIQDTIHQMQHIVTVYSDLNVSDIEVPINGDLLDNVTSSVPGLSEASSTISGGLQTVSNAKNMSDSQLSTLSTVSGVSSSTIIGLADGSLSGSAASTENINSALTSLDQTAHSTDALSAINDAINTVNTTAGSTVAQPQLTSTSVKKAMDQISGGESTVTISGIGTVENSKGSAEGITEMLSNLISTSGGDPSTLVSQFIGKSPGISASTLANPQILNTMLPNSSASEVTSASDQILSQASSVVQGKYDSGSDMTSSFDAISDNANKLSSAQVQLQSITEGIYTKANVKARIERMNGFKDQITSILSSVFGFSI